MVFYQPHSAPGVYARAFVGGRLSEQDLQHYRQEITAQRSGARGLSSYQRLDGPVRGNGRIVDELEAQFNGAGWNVIKLLWGSDWDGLFAQDSEGALIRAFADYQCTRSCHSGGLQSPAPGDLEWRSRGTQVDPAHESELGPSRFGWGRGGALQCLFRQYPG